MLAKLRIILFKVMPHSVITICALADKAANHTSTAFDTTLIATTEEALVMDYIFRAYWVWTVSSTTGIACVRLNFTTSCTSFASIIIFPTMTYARLY
jgi:hypothetical protein